MSLENLAKIGQLKPHTPDKRQLGDLLAAAARNLRDAGNRSISAEARFDCAYNALFQSALVALQASGYRPDTKRPGHHMTVIQSLTLTMGIEGSRVMVLDKLREKRNRATYTGAGLEDVTTDACVEHAARLASEVEAWLKKTHPDLA